MIELSSGTNYSNKYSSDTISIAKQHKKLRLPRHISSLESRTHNRSYSSKLQTFSVCLPIFEDSPNSNVAWSILKYQLSRPSLQKHLANLQSNLEHRLSVARVQGNERLVQILQEEFRQLQNK